MHPIFDFHEGDNVTLYRPKATAERQKLYASLGIFEGASATVFLVSGKKAILAVSGSKFAFSEHAASELFAEKAP